MKREMVFQSDTCQLARVRQAARNFLSEAGVDDCLSNLVVLALDEAFTNIIRYAYEHRCRPVRLLMTFEDSQLRFVLRDYGKSCDPSQIRSRALEDFRPGGLGVHIIRKVFDTVRYEPCARGTRLTLVKKLHGRYAD